MINVPDVSNLFYQAVACPRNNYNLTARHAHPIEQLPIMNQESNCVFNDTQQDEVDRSRKQGQSLWQERGSQDIAKKQWTTRRCGIAEEL